MATDQKSPLKTPLWSGRMVEWSILAVVILILAGVFGRQVRTMQGQSELAAIRSTLGALRTALVIDHLRQKILESQSSVVGQQLNPFLLLKALPPNYVGELSMLKIAELAPGSWLFDADCICIAYQPLDPEWLESPLNTQSIWFRVIGTSGLLQIVAQNTYVWQGQSLK